MFVLWIRINDNLSQVKQNNRTLKSDGLRCKNQLLCLELTDLLDVYRHTFNFVGDDVLGCHLGRWFFF
jgi:hypothetical protein